MESMGGGHGPHIQKKSNNDNEGNSIIKGKRHRPDQSMILAPLPQLYERESTFFFFLSERAPYSYSTGITHTLNPFFFHKILFVLKYLIVMYGKSQINY
jgi:hypothetical protein